jgi:hypothetical protein
MNQNQSNASIAAQWIEPRTYKTTTAVVHRTSYTTVYVGVGCGGGGGVFLLIILYCICCR